LSYDQPGKSYRFTIIYYLLSLTYNIRYNLFIQTTALLGCETISAIYSSANWSERELWDIFGIFIFLHPDLRRLLTDYGFQGFPLRKDFPLSGYKELLYSDFTNQTEYKKVSLIQGLRTYKYGNPWIDNIFNLITVLEVISVHK
jgi:NADH:ubiquinone oxidoreductase subunit C